MAIFDPAEATQFASGLGVAAVPPASFRSWINDPALPRHLQEGTTNFDIHRELSLREVERLLLLSASHYRRTYDLLTETSASWAFVTLYYGAYFAASALLGMFGAWMLRSGKVLEPVATASGAQRFEIQTRHTSYSGSHQRFWDFYYFNGRFLKPYVPSRYHFALTPVSGDVIWPIRNRNELNYDSFTAVQLASAHKASFDAANFPGSLPGVLNTQFRLLEILLSLAGSCANTIGIETSALAPISSLGSRVARINALVVRAQPPKLGNRVKRKVASSAGN